MLLTITTTFQPATDLGHLLTHLYVLIPVLDNDKHYWVGDDEVDKLLRHGDVWLGTHPERESITTRYLKYRRSLVRDALERLIGEEDADPDVVQSAHAQEEAAVEVIGHLDPPRLAALERVLFECARPATVVLTIPNAEYNVKWESLPAGRFRHRDHRFEWSRAKVQSWANGVAGRFGYGVRFLPVGPEDSSVGAPTQMAVLTRA